MMINEPSAAQMRGRKYEVYDTKSIREICKIGINLNHRFRETSEGGLAKLYTGRRK